MNYLLTLIIQIAVIIVVSRLMGYLFRKIKQPQVIGEMTAGILLGPSLLGWAAPKVSMFIFPAGSLSYLNILSQLGLLFFMFIVGLELDPKLLKGKGHSAILISHLSIILPFIFGTSLALYLYPLLSNNSVTFTAFALFLGASMSITAFPVLARILVERNIIKTKLGALTIACAAVDDVTAWSILAVVVTIIRAGSEKNPLWLTIGGAIVFILLMLFIIRPLLKKLDIIYKNKGNRLTHDLLGLIILLMLTSAWTTEWLGIHALFGAFFMGAMLPRNKKFLKDIIKRLNDVTLIILLPVFFALTGLKTSVGLISGTEMWFFLFLILAAAIGGKLGGSFIGARLTSIGWRESLGIGILMNTRGLMELIILTIGLELNVISPALFTMMVLMALLTTFMTTPFLEWFYPQKYLKLKTEEPEKNYRVLIPVSLPSSGPGLMKIASAISTDESTEIYALHLVKQNNTLFSNQDGASDFNESGQAFKPLLKIAKDSSLTVHPFSFVSKDPADDIIQMAQIKKINLILMGWHKPVLSESILSGTVHEVMKNAKADVCVYLERVFTPYRNILVPFTGGIHDMGALELSKKIAFNLKAALTILHITNPSERKRTSVESLADDGLTEGTELLEMESNNPLKTTLEISNRNFDLIVIGLSDQWKLEASLFNKKHELLAHRSPSSLLIVRKYKYEIKPYPSTAMNQPFKS